MKNWIKELLTNNQPLKRVGGLTFKIGDKMNKTEINTLIKQYQNTIDSCKHSISQWNNRLKKAQTKEEKIYFETEIRVFVTEVECYNNVISNLKRYL